MTKYYVEVWSKLKEGESKNFDQQKAKVREIKSFHDPIDAWNYILMNKITTFTVYKAECVIDES